MLSIHMLGEFSIENEYNRFPKDRKKSVQVIILIAYLITKRHTMVTKSTLIEVLWPKHDIDNPEGALRNLIYRARKELSAFFPEDKKVKCILSKGNAYAWNSEVPQIIDVDDMEKLCERINNEQNMEDMRMDALQLSSRYNEDFMHEFLSEEWVAQECDVRQQLLLNTLEKACKTFMNEEKYEYVIELCSYIDFKQFYNSSIHEYKLQSYFNLNQIAPALSYYHKVVNQYYSQLGMEPTNAMVEIYKHISEKTLPDTVNAGDLVERLNGENAERGAFYCDFDIFRNIYHINQRSLRRTARYRYLVLLTLESNGEISDRDMAKDCDVLHKVIVADLRKNDVFSKCNAMQYAVIISTSNEEGCVKAMDRIISKFEMKKKHKEVNITFDIREIS